MLPSEAQIQGGSSSFQGGAPWEIGPPSDRYSSPQSFQSNHYSPSLSSSPGRPLCPTAQISLLSLNPLAPPFDLSPGASQYFPPPPSSPLSLPPPPAFAVISPFQYQQQVIDRQEQILTSIQNRNASPVMAPLNLPTGQPAPNAFQFNNNIHGFPPSLTNLLNTSQDSANSNDSFRTQVPLPWNLPSEYENNGGVAIPDPSPFADPPTLPFPTPDFTNGHDGRAQYQPFANQNSNMNGAPVGGFGQENGYHVPQGQQQQQNFGMGMNGMHMNGMNMNGMNMNGMNMNGMHGMNGYNGANNAYQPSPYNGQIGGPQHPQVDNGQMNQHNQHQVTFNGHGAPVQPNFQHQNMGMRPQLAPLATQFPPNPYNTPQYNQAYSAPPIGMNPHQFYNGVGGNNHYRGPNSNPGSASSMISNMNFGSLSLGMSPNGIGIGTGPNCNQNNGYGHGANGNIQPAPVNNNNNPAASARNAQYSSLPSVAPLYHPLPPKPEFHAQKPLTSNKPKTDLGHHAYAAINCNPQPVVHTPQQKQQSVPSQQGVESQQSSNSVKSRASSHEFPVSATASEPRANFTPMLRSSRGKTITASVDRAQQVNDWVQNTPTRGSSSRENSVAGEGVVDNTPKMLEGAETMQVADAFTPRPLTTNPFACAEMPPFSPNSKYGAANNMSHLLAELTRNGTQVPTADEATSLRFLPFEEYCRQAKPVQWGVMKIRNVS